MTTITIGNGTTIVSVGSNLTLKVGNGNDTITAESDDTITVGNGNDTITAGSSDTITVGNGNDTVIAGSGDTIKAGNGKHTITAGAFASITTGNGNDSISAGPDSAITAGSGSDTISAGHDSAINLGDGNDKINAGASDTITIGHGSDTINYAGLTPRFTVPATLSVNEEHAVALPITILPPALGNEVITGFSASSDVIGLDTADFANLAAVKLDAAQVGANTVITEDAGDTITLKGVALSSLSAKNFQFFTGSSAIAITGVPTDATLSAGTNNGNGSWTLTPVQLAGLQLVAGEPTTTGLPANLTVTVTNPAGQLAAASQDIALTVNPEPPTVGVSVLAPQPGDPVTETRLQVTASVDDADSGNDYINRIQLGGLPPGAILSGSGLTGGTIATSGHPGTFSTEVDVNTPAGESTNFNLGVTAYSDETSGTGGPTPEVSATTNQSIAIDYSTDAQPVTFQATNQSIWDSGTAGIVDDDRFLGINTHLSGSTGVDDIASAGYDLSLKAGFDSDLHLTSGDFSADLPYQIGVDSTYNKTSDALQIDATDTALPGADFTAHGPGGNYELDFDFSLFAKVFGSFFGASTSATIPTIAAKFPILKLTALLSHVATIGLPPGSEDPVAKLSFAWPNVTTTGSGGPGTISGDGVSNNNLVQANVDLVALALAALGITPNPLDLGFVDIASLNLFAGIDLTQHFDLKELGLTPTLTLEDGTVEPFSFGTPLTIANASSHDTNHDGNVAYTLSLTPDATLHNVTGLGGDAGIELKLLDFETIGAIVDQKMDFQVGSIPIYSNTFPVAFNSQSVNLAAG
jgi:hypothetical protein